MKRFWVVFFVTFALVSAAFPNLAYGQVTPDLVIVAGPSGPAQVINSQNDTVSVTITNAGTDTTRSQFDVTVYFSADSVVDAGENVGVAAISDPLAPGDSLVVRVPVQMPALLALGAYLWVAQVDAQAGVAESDETNNVLVGNAVQLVSPPSDLTITTAPSGIIEINLNASSSVALDIQNQGSGPTLNAFNVVVYLSADSLLDATDISVGESTISDPLTAGASRSLQISVSIPQTHPLGSFHWLASVDTLGVESESNEANNTAVGNGVEVVEKLADLVISVPPSGPNGVFRQGTYTVSTQIRNQGTGENTAAFDVVIYLSEDLVVGNSDDVKVGDVAISDTVPVDSTRAVEVPVTISALQAFQAYHWVAVVDGVAFVKELNENNNALIGHAVSVVPSPSDLVAENISAPVLVMRDGVYAVSVEVVNAGDGPTGGALQVAFYISADDTVGNSDDVRVGNATLTDILVAGDRTTVNLEVVMPSMQAFGEYRLLAIADASGIEAEANENNNSVFAAAPLALVPSPPDLLFVTDPVGPERLFRGVVDTVSMQIRNQGAGDVTGEFDITVFMSQDTIFADDDDIAVGTLKITDQIISGRTLDVKVPVSVSTDQALGTYRWWASVDSGEALDEADEANNLRTGVAVSIVEFPADLVIFDVITAPSQVARGGVFDVSVPVRNQGVGPATSGFQIAVYLSTDERLDDEDTLTGGQRFNELLPAGEERTVTLSVAIPIDQVVADYRWIVRVNAVGLQEEVDESNNTWLGELVSFPVLTVSPSALDFGAVRVGESVALTFEILNGGTANLSFEISSSDPQVSISPRSVEGLPAGVRWQVTVTFTPTKGDSLGGLLNITSNGAEGAGNVQISGLGIVPETDRVTIDLDLADGNQGKTSRLEFVGHGVPVDFYIENVPAVVSAELWIQFDATKLMIVGDNWAVGNAFSQGVTGIEQIEPGQMKLKIDGAGTTIGVGSGQWGQVVFETLEGFRGSTATLSVVQLVYQLAEGQVDTLALDAQAALVYDQACWGDINTDGVINLADFLFFLEAFDKTTTDEGWATELADPPFPKTPFKRYDGNGDGVVDLSDFILFTQVFGQSCTP